MSTIERTAAPSSGLTKEQEEKIAGVPAGGETGQVLTKKSNISYDDEWKASAGGPPSGAAGGELAGEYPNPSIAEGAIDNGDIKAAAGIEDSKLALTTVVKLTGNQTIEGAKIFTGVTKFNVKFEGTEAKLSTALNVPLIQGLELLKVEGNPGTVTAKRIQLVKNAAL